MTLNSSGLRIGCCAISTTNKAVPKFHSVAATPPLKPGTRPTSNRKARHFLAIPHGKPSIARDTTQKAGAPRTPGALLCTGGLPGFWCVVNRAVHRHGSTDTAKHRSSLFLQSCAHAACALYDRGLRPWREVR